MSRLKGDFDNIQEFLTVTVACPSTCLARCRLGRKCGKDANIAKEVTEDEGDV